MHFFPAKSRAVVGCGAVLLAFCVISRADDLKVVPGVGIELVKIPAGKFAMGSPKSDPLRYTDEPVQVEITLTKDFWLGKTEVTQGQWEALMGNNPSAAKKTGPTAPVESVTWEDAMAFCAKLTERERAAGRLPEGYVYSLPTEPQWEYACRAGTVGTHAGKLDDVAWYSRNGGISPHPVAQKQPNAWGLFDMHGNVWEWTADWYRESVIGRGGDGIDPAGAVQGTLRVLRGGAFNMPDAAARSSYRLRLEPETKKITIGFRLALVVPLAPKPEAPAPPRRRGGQAAAGEDPNAVLEIPPAPPASAVEKK
jgi:formylglycine-generating enzyme required for sulfatase activity